MHYQTHNPDNVVFCCMCVYTKVQKDGSKQRQFCFYKDATISFKNHEASASHKEALQAVMVLRKFVSRASENIYGLTNLKMLPPPLLNNKVSYCVWELLSFRPFVRTLHTTRPIREAFFGCR